MDNFDYKKFVFNAKANINESRYAYIQGVFDEKDRNPEY